ncbi:MAG TPA: hypothetical protein VFF28_00770 [Candidatus Nanoarchaeia archaeon]|nr:hypothetical protein [Candidatus Nanoarchaeia archaeon]
MTNPLLQALEELRKEEKLKEVKKKRAPFGLRKEKRLQYYSGWHKDDKPVTETRIEQQKKL